MCSIALCGTLAAASAKPAVALKLAGTVTESGPDGKPVTVPVEAANPKPGQRISYTITARNSGNDAARAFVPVGRIPSGTQFDVETKVVPGLAGVEFSLDGGKTWAAKPMIHARTADGKDVVRAADPSSYTAIRWRNGNDLPAHAVRTYSYAVTVK